MRKESKKFGGGVSEVNAQLYYICEGLSTYTTQSPTRIGSEYKTECKLKKIQENNFPVLKYKRMSKSLCHNKKNENLVCIKASV